MPWGNLPGSSSPAKPGGFAGRGDAAERVSFRACAEAKDTELASTRAGQGTDNAVFVAAGGSVGTGIGCCWNGSLWTFFRDPVGSALYGAGPVVIQVGKPYEASGQDERKPGTPGTFWKERRNAELAFARRLRNRGNGIERAPSAESRPKRGSPDPAFLCAEGIADNG